MCVQRRVKFLHRCKDENLKFDHLQMRIGYLKGLIEKLLPLPWSKSIKVKMRSSYKKLINDRRNINWPQGNGANA